MAHAKARKRLVRPRATPGPRTAAASRNRPLRNPVSEPPKLALDDHQDFLRKCCRVHRLLEAQRVPKCSAAIGAAWALAFADEGDPTFCVLEWVEAGWKDPLLVDAALRICGTRELAEACMHRIREEVGGRYSHSLVARLATAMIAVTGQQQSPPQDI
jgi:hypothetical protein